MIAWVIEQALSLDPQGIVVVVGHGAEDVERAAREAAGDVELTCVVQEPQLGTGHAVQMAAPALGAAPDSVVVLYGDMPLLLPESLSELILARRELGAGGIAILSAFAADPTGYGRVVRDPDGTFTGVTEHKDCSAEELGIDEINLGVYAFAGPELLADLPRIGNENSQDEYYLPDLLLMATQAERPVATVTIEDNDEGLGINDLTQLSEARWALQVRILEQHMLNGVLIEDPATTFIAHNVEIGAGTHILPCTYLHSGVRIGVGCEVGPFTHLRVGTVLEDGAEVGNFTECKKSTIGAGSKAKHLSYIGDAQIGAKVNVGAGTIFANYDGVHKHTTVVGDRAFIGSGTIIVAPNEIPAGATTGAGAVVTRSADMSAGEVWVGMPARNLAKSKKSTSGS